MRYNPAHNLDLVESKHNRGRQNPATVLSSEMLDFGWSPADKELVLQTQGREFKAQNFLVVQHWVGRDRQIPVALRPVSFRW